jgi:hypothetical protein
MFNKKLNMFFNLLSKFKLDKKLCFLALAFIVVCSILFQRPESYTNSLTDLTSRLSSADTNNFSFDSMNKTPSLAGSSIKTRHYNDYRVRLMDEIEFRDSNESRHFGKVNYWHPSRVRIISSDAWSLCTNSNGSDLDIFAYLWTRVTSFDLRKVIRRTWVKKKFFLS